MISKIFPSNQPFKNELSWQGQVSARPSALIERSLMRPKTVNNCFKMLFLWSFPKRLNLNPGAPQATLQQPRAAETSLRVAVPHGALEQARVAANQPRPQANAKNGAAESAAPKPVGPTGGT